VIASAALKARRLTRELFGAYVCTGLIAVCFGWLFMNALGVQGALVAMIVTSTVANVMFWRAYRTAVPERAHLYGEHRGWLP